MCVFLSKFYKREKKLKKRKKYVKKYFHKARVDWHLTKVTLRSNSPRECFFRKDLLKKDSERDQKAPKFSSNRGYYSKCSCKSSTVNNERIRIIVERK